MTVLEQPSGLWGSRRLGVLGVLIQAVARRSPTSCINPNERSTRAAITRSLCKTSRRGWKRSALVRYAVCGTRSAVCGDMHELRCLRFAVCAWRCCYPSLRVAAFSRCGLGGAGNEEDIEDRWEKQRRLWHVHWRSGSVSSEDNTQRTHAHTGAETREGGRRAKLTNG